MLSRIDFLPDHVVAVEATGSISAQDYENTVIPAVEQALERHDKVNFIMVLGNDFKTYEAEAIWKDTVFGFKHFSDFEKVGVVTDRTWIAESMRLFSPLIPAETKAFPVTQKDEALRWAAD